MKKLTVKLCLLFLLGNFQSFAGEGYLLGGIVEQAIQMMRDRAEAEELGEKIVLREQKLFKVSSTFFDGDVRYLTVEKDSNDRIVGLKLTSSKESDKRFNVGSINSGITLLRDSGKNVITLTGEDFSLISGGWAKVEYLVNGITGSKSSFWVKLQIGSDGVWKAYHGGKRIWSTNFVPNKVIFAGVVGVKEVKFTYY